MIELVDGPFVNDPLISVERDPLQVARSFLQAERSLAVLENDRDLAELISSFLTAAQDVRLRLSRPAAGVLVVSAPVTRLALRITGRTAEVLLSYLEGKPVTFEERMEMTARAKRSRIHETAGEEARPRTP